MLTELRGGPLDGKQVNVTIKPILPQSIIFLPEPSRYDHPGFVTEEPGPDAITRVRTKAHVYVLRTMADGPINDPKTRTWPVWAYGYDTKV